MFKRLAITAAIIFALIPELVSAHESRIFTSKTCSSWSADIWVYGDTSAQHRLIITKDDKVVRVTTISHLGWLKLSHKTGSLPATKTFRVYIYDKVEGSYIYNPPLGSPFRPLATIGKFGLVDYESATVSGSYSCGGYRGVRRG